VKQIFHTFADTLCDAFLAPRRRALSVSCASAFFGVSHPNGMQREPRQAAFEEERLRRRHVIRLLSRLAALHDVCQQWLPWKVQAVLRTRPCKKGGDHVRFSRAKENRTRELHTR
jgi:hypothetical protein